MCLFFIERGKKSLCHRVSLRSKCKQNKAFFVRNCSCHLSGRVLYVHVGRVKTCLLGGAVQGRTSESGLIRGPSLSRIFFFFGCLYLPLAFSSLSLSAPSSSSCPSPNHPLPSFSSYFSLLLGARRSVPDGNSLRLQEPPRRPHGGGTGG